MIERFRDEYPKFFFPSEEILNRIKDIYTSCGIGQSKLVLGPTGKVRLCLLMHETDGVIGDLTKTSYRNFLAMADLKFFHELKMPGKERCLPCEYALYCHNCLARVFEVRKRCGPEKHETFCSWNQEWKITDSRLKSPAASADSSPPAK